jgi:hypothetical protein
MHQTITIDLHDFDEVAMQALGQTLALHNARLYRARPDLPGLYRSGVVYRQEHGELWSDVVRMYARGREDCDALAAARAGELLARGWRALLPADPGYRLAKRAALTSIPTTFLLVRSTPSLLHAVVSYRIGRHTLSDDPSARLGMNGGLVDRHVLALWQREQITPRLLRG